MCYFWRPDGKFHEKNIVLGHTFAPQFCINDMMNKARANFHAIRKHVWMASLNKAQSNHHDVSETSPDVPNRPSDVEGRVRSLQVLLLADRGVPLSNVSVAREQKYTCLNKPSIK